MILLMRKGERMLYPYIELPDETIITHSEILENNSVLINFEQPYDDGFSNEQIKFFVQFAHKNAAVIYKYARLGGIDNA